jgi:biopolymer transport protein ExbD
MRWGLLSVRIAMIAVSLLIAVLVILSVVPLATGQLQVSVPETEDQEATFNDGVVTVTVPVDVYNGGYFDITDLRVFMQLANEGRQLTDYRSDPYTIQAGKDNHLDLVMAIDLNDIPADELKDLVFNSADLDLSVGVQASYTMGLISTSIHSNQTMEWDPLISDIVVDTDATTTTMDGENLVVSVPYSFHAQSFIGGTEVEIASTISNSTSVITTASQTVTLQEYNQGSLTFVIPPEDAAELMGHPEYLIIGADFTYREATYHLERPYHWEGMA